MERDESNPSARRAQRAQYNGTVKIVLGNAEASTAPLEVPIVDVSVRGLSFLDSLPYDYDEQFILQMEAPDGRVLSILSRVIYCAQVSDGRYKIGVEFTCTHDEKQYQQSHFSPEDLMKIRHRIID